MDLDIEMNAENASLLASLMLPNNVMITDKGSQKRFVAVIEQQAKLTEWLLETGFQPFPFPEAVAILYREKGNEVPSALITTWLAFANQYPVSIQTGVETYDKGAVKRRGVVKNFSTKEIKRLSTGVALPKIKLATQPIADELPERVLYADQVSTWFAGWVGDQLDLLTPEQVDKLVSLLLLELEQVEEEGVLIGFAFAKDNAEYFFSLSQRFVTTRSSNRTAMAKVSLSGKTVSSRVLLFSLLMQVGSKRFGDKVDDAYNRRPNLWEREPNYGVEWELDNPTKIINDDGRLSSKFVERDNGEMLSIYPFILSQTEKHDAGQLSKTIAEEGDAVPDKYNIKFVGGALASKAGGTAMVTRDGKLFKRSMHEQKLAKAYNRVMQARKFLCAESTLLRVDGSAKGRERSMFRTIL